MKLNKFVIRSHNWAIMCSFDRTENRINILCSSLKQGYGSEEHYNSPAYFLTQTTKRSRSHFRGRGRNGKNNTQTPEKAICIWTFGAVGKQSTTSAIFIKWFSSILLCFSFTSCLDMSSEAFCTKPTVCKILMIDVTTKEIVNTTLFSVSTIYCRPKKSSSPEQFWFGPQWRSVVNSG